MLHGRTLWLIYSIYNNLHLLTPNSHSTPSPAPSPLATPEYTLLKKIFDFYNPNPSLFVWVFFLANRIFSAPQVYREYVHLSLPALSAPDLGQPDLTPGWSWSAPDWCPRFCLLPAVLSVIRPAASPALRTVQATSFGPSKS